MDRQPKSGKPPGIDEAYAITPFTPRGSTKNFWVPPTIQTDFENYLMTDVPGSNYTFEWLRNWYDREAADYEPHFIRGMYYPINWKSKIGNSDANSNFRTILQNDIRKGDIVVREDGVIFMLNWQVQRHINNLSTQAIDCNAYIDFYREVDEVLDERGYLLEEAGKKVIVPNLPCVYSEYAGRPDYATNYNTPGITPDHLLTVQVQFNSFTENLCIGDKFTLMHSTYHIVHLIDREVDIDRLFGIINITARRSAGEEVT